MKTLIWIGCCFFAGLINTIIRPEGAVFAGLFAGGVSFSFISLAIYLCKRVDAHEMSDEYRKILDEIETLYTQGKLSREDYVAERQRILDKMSKL